MKYIEEGWQSYRTEVLPSDASAIQLQETEHAFFAGALILFTTLMMALDGGEEATDADMQRMADLQAEIDEYGAKLDKAAFGSTEH